jgi:hypothetical protein
MARRVGRAFDFEQNEHGNSGLLAADNGTRIFLEEVDLQDPIGVDLYLRVPDVEECRPDSPVEVVRAGTRG